MRAVPNTVRRSEPLGQSSFAHQRPAGVRVLAKGPLTIPRDPFHVALLTLVLLNISRMHQQFSLVKAIRPELVLTIVCIGLAYAKPAFLSKRHLLETWPARGVAIFAGLACFSAIFGISLG